MSWDENAFSSGGDKSDKLIVIIHGLGGSGRQLSSVAETAVTALGATDVYMPDMAYGGKSGALNSTPPAKIVCELLEAVDALETHRADRKQGPYKKIFILGYSMGALVARKLAVVAHGEFDAAPFEPGYERYRAARTWAGQVDRVVLLGGVSRGWSARSAGNWLTSTFWSLCILLATILPARRGMVMETRFGLPFSVQTRLQWLALSRAGKREVPLIQLLGSRDDVVSPDDMIDVAVDGIANRSHALLDMAGTGHVETVHMGKEAGAAERRALLEDALQLELASLAAHPAAIAPALLSDGKTPEPEDEVTDMVFVVHGIRDKGFWTSKVAREIKREAAQQPLSDGTPRNVRSMTESYGYLAMLPFLWVGVRRAKAAWLMDRYVEARARYPRAKFHFVGHSNGTYLAARALKDYPAASFERIVFAGSVVRANYEWAELITKPRPQVQAVLNYVASNDLVVSIFPSAFGCFDLGGAGHSGFQDIMLNPKGAGMPRVFSKTIGENTCYQVHFSRGGHGSGIVETQWDEIARFVVTGSPPRPVNADYVGSQSPLARMMGTRPPIGLFLCVAIYASVALILAWLSPWAFAVLIILTATVLFRV